MLDIISILLSFASLLQNIKTKESLKEKIKCIEDALYQVDEVYKLLRDSKQIHNSFDNFLLAGMQPLHVSCKRNNISPDEVEDHIDTFLVFYSKFIVLPASYIELSKIDNEYVKKLPVEIRNNVEMIYILQPRVIDSINTFEKNKIKLDELKKSRNFGVDFKECVIKLNNATTEILDNSDKVILNSTPLLDYIHSEIKKYIKEI